MSRSRKVEPEAAVSAAMSLFWTHGFNALGTRQIEEETGITRFTLQTTYGGKMKLYLAALDGYLDMFENSGLLSATDGDLEGIATFFDIRGNPEAMPAIACQGCIMLNSMMEFSTNIAEINQRADRYFTMLRQRFSSALETAKSKGNLPKTFDIHKKTEVLLSATLGLNAVIRASKDHIVGQEMAGAIAEMVREWHVPASL